MMFHWLLNKVLPMQIIYTSLITPIMPDRPRLFDALIMLDDKAKNLSKGSLSAA